MKNAIMCLFGVLSASLFAERTVCVWQGADGGSWDDPANWVGGTVPDDYGDQADFSAAAGDYTVTLGKSGAYILAQIVLKPASPCNLTLKSRLESGSVLNVSHPWGGDQCYVNVTSGSKVILDGVDLSGTARYLKVGSGELHFASAQTHTGIIVVDGGTVRVDTENVLPLVHYKFDDAENLGKDSGILGKDLTNSEGEASYSSAGRHGGCIDMKGAQLWADSAVGLPAGNSEFSVSFWVKDLSQNYNNYWWCWGDIGDYWRVNRGGLLWPNDRFYQYFRGSATDNFEYHFDVSKPPFGSEWSHVAFTCGKGTSGECRRLYINGVEVASLPNEYRNVMTNGVFGIGINVDADGCKAEGTEGRAGSKMDDYMIFGHELTPEQVMSIYESSRSGAYFSRSKLSDSVKIHCGSGGKIVFGAGEHVLAQTIDSVGTMTLDEGCELKIAAVAGARCALGKVEGPGRMTLSGSGAQVRFPPAGDAKVNVSGTVQMSGGSIGLDDPRLVAYWKFDDPDDPGKDSGPNGMTLAPKTGCSWADFMEWCTMAKYTASANEKWLVLADSAKHSFLPGAANGNYTFAAWVRPANGNDGGNFVEWGLPDDGTTGWCRKLSFGLVWSGVGTYPLWSGHNAADDVRFYVNGNARNENDASAYEGSVDMWTTNDAPGRWHHIAIVCATGCRKVFFDGELVYEAGTGSEKINLAQAEFKLGKANGGMDEVMIFNAALDDGEIPLLMGGLGDPEPSTFEVSAGGSVTAEGPVAIKAGTIAGRIDAERIIIAEDAQLGLSVEPSAAAANLTGDFDLPESMTVTLDVEWADRHATFPLFGGSGLDPAVTGGWTVKSRIGSGPEKVRKAAFGYVGGILSAQLLKSGFWLWMR